MATGGNLKRLVSAAASAMIILEDAPYAPGKANEQCASILANLVWHLARIRNFSESYSVTSKSCSKWFLFKVSLVLSESCYESGTKLSAELVKWSQKRLLPCSLLNRLANVKCTIFQLKHWTCTEFVFLFRSPDRLERQLLKRSPLIMSHIMRASMPICNIRPSPLR